MAFFPTPPRTNSPAQLLPLSAITTTVIQQSGGSSGSPGAVTITSPPTTGTADVALFLAGTVAPSGTAVQAGLSTSTSTAPSSWTAATISGTGWSASLTPSAAGTYYIWVEQTATPSIREISAAVVIGSATGSALSYSLITGSGNSSLSGTTLVTATSIVPAVDWTSIIAPGATDVAPNVLLSAMGSIATCKFWFDTTNTGVTVAGTYGNGAVANGLVAFYSNSLYSTPTGAPAAPSTPGTYYGKYAFYNSAATLLGVFTTSAITVT